MAKRNWKGKFIVECRCFMGELGESFNKKNLRVDVDHI